MAKITDLKKFGYSILVPTGDNPSVPSVYKVYFGSKYLIWKGKSLLQSCEILAKSISAALSKQRTGTKIPETDYLYHVMAHIKKTRVLFAKVEVEANDFFDDEGKVDAGLLLRFEQKLLDEADGDENCLNNNEQAYVPVSTTWISEEVKQSFLKWYKRRKK